MPEQVNFKTTDTYCKIVRMIRKPVRRHISYAIFAIACFLSLTSVNLSQTAGRPRTAPTPTPTPAASPTPTPSASPSPAPVAIQTIEELQTKIRQRLFAIDVRRGRIGIKVVSLNSGKVIFENESEKYYMPASNMKNFTVATAMERLGPDFRFRTTVTANSPLDANGVVKGPLTVRGGGDISISNAWDPAFPKQVNPYWGIDLLVDKIVAAGVKWIDGDIIGDESYFQGFAIPATWEWDDLQSYYGTEISALPVNDNVIDVNVMPGSVGNACIARVSPANQLVRIINKCTTAAAGTKRSLNVFKLIDQNVIEITGSMPAGEKEHTDSVALTHPAELFVAMLKQRLAAMGIGVSGTTRVTNQPPPAPCPTCAAPVITNIASLESPPLSVIAQKTMKPSQNMYTETILWTLGEQIGRKTGASGDSAQIGLAVVKKFLGEIGIPADGIVQYDGSGLSRHNLITPAAIVTLYSYMAKQSRYAMAWRESLSIGGVDGTLRNRFKGTAAAGNIRGKTGTIDQVSALSGYLTTAGGEHVIVSIVVNGVPTNSERVSLIDNIVVNLANFNGKLDQ